MVHFAHNIGAVPLVILDVASAESARPPCAPLIPSRTGKDRYVVGAKVTLDTVTNSVTGTKKVDEIETTSQSISEGKRIVRLLRRNPELDTVLTHLQNLGFRQLVLTEKESGDLSGIQVNGDNINEIRSDEDFSWAQVDDAIIFFNPDYTRRRSNAELLTILEHELWHMFEERAFSDVIDGLHNTFNTFEIDELDGTILMSIKHLYLLVHAYQLGRRKFAHENIELRKRDVSNFLKKLTNGRASKVMLFLYISQMLEMAMTHRLINNALGYMTYRTWLKIIFRRTIPDRKECNKLMELGDRYAEELLKACTRRGRLKTHGVEEEVRNIIGRMLGHY
jgi:hypothetical protein